MPSESRNESDPLELELDVVVNNKHSKQLKPFLQLYLKKKKKVTLVKIM